MLGYRPLKPFSGFDNVQDPFWVFVELISGLDNLLYTWGDDNNVILSTIVSAAMLEVYLLQLRNFLNLYNACVWN